MLGMYIQLTYQPPAAGLITYRETALLTSPTSNIFDYRYIAHVVAHEMTHQVTTRPVFVSIM